MIENFFLTLASLHYNYEAIGNGGLMQGKICESRIVNFRTSDDGSLLFLSTDAGVSVAPSEQEDASMQCALYNRANSAMFCAYLDFDHNDLQKPARILITTCIGLDGAENTRLESCLIDLFNPDGGVAFFCGMLQRNFTIDDEPYYDSDDEDYSDESY